MKTSQDSIVNISGINQNSSTGQKPASEQFQQQPSAAQMMMAYGTSLTGSSSRGNGATPLQFQGYPQQQSHANQFHQQAPSQTPQPMQQQQYYSSQVPQQQLQEQFQLQQQNVQARLAGSLSASAGNAGAGSRSAQVSGWHVGGTGSMGGSIGGGMGLSGNQQNRQQKVAAAVPENRQPAIKGFGNGRFSLHLLLMRNVFLIIVSSLSINLDKLNNCHN